MEYALFIIIQLIAQKLMARRWGKPKSPRDTERAQKGLL